MKKRTPPIYTFVIGKKLSYIFAAVIFCGLAAMGTGKMIAKAPLADYSYIFKLCLGETMGLDVPHHTKKPPPLSVYTLFGQALPIFDNMIYSPEKAEPPDAAVKAETPDKAVTQKAIVSKNLDIKNETDYTVDPSAMAEIPREYGAADGTPRVLIVHTHGCETYSDDKGYGIGEDGAYRTRDNTKNMVAVGKAMAEVFRSRGIGVIHDTTLCDYPDYNSSYVRSAQVIDYHLQNTPAIDFVFDIHRDAIEAADGTPTKLLCRINGRDTAQAMIVCGTDAMGLENPGWRENLTLAFKIQKKLETDFPGFMRPVNLRRERFNMHKTKGSLLFEVGTHGNTLDEAINGAKLLAQGVAECIR